RCRARPSWPRIRSVRRSPSLSWLWRRLKGPQPEDAYLRLIDPNSQTRSRGTGDVTLSPSDRRLLVARSIRHIAAKRETLLGPGVEPRVSDFYPNGSETLLNSCITPPCRRLQRF